MVKAFAFRRPGRYPRRARGRRNRYRGKRTSLKGFSRTQTRSLARYLGRSEETKYFSQQLCVNQLLDAAIHSPGTDIMPLVPPVPQGTGEWQRVGRRISPTKCRVDLSLTFGQVDVGAAPSAEVLYGEAIYVAIYILRSKEIHNWPQFNTSTEWQYLLDDGQGNSTSFGILTPGGGSNPSFWTTNMQHLQMPIETSHFTQVRKKIIKLVRNQGNVRTGVSGEAPNMSSSFYKGSFTYRLPKLMYDDTKDAPSGTYPTNSTVVLALGYAFADNLWAQNQVPDGQVQPIPMLSVTARNHVWYKDA